MGLKTGEEVNLVAYLTLLGPSFRHNTNQVQFLTYSLLKHRDGYEF
jgi:hypothetical protein